MELKLLRLNSQPDWTLGVMYRTDLAIPRFLCSTCEDERREKKVPGETRIPAGRYEIKLRIEDSPKNQKYKNMYSWHVGMLWLQNVPNFTYVYVHVGNDDDDTDGCILVGQTSDWITGVIGRSKPAYKELYHLIVSALLAEEPVFLTIEDVA